MRGWYRVFIYLCNPQRNTMDSLKAKQESTVKTNLIKGREHEFYDSTLSINTLEMAIDYFRLRYMLYSK